MKTVYAMVIAKKMDKQSLTRGKTFSYKGVQYSMKGNILFGTTQITIPGLPKLPMLAHVVTVDKITDKGIHWSGMCIDAPAKGFISFDETIPEN